MINKTELIKLLEELEQYHDEQANNHNDELLSNPDEYRKSAYERANGIRDSLIVIYDMDETEAIPVSWLINHLPNKDDYILIKGYPMFDEDNPMNMAYDKGYADGWKACCKAIINDTLENWRAANEDKQINTNS